MTMTPRRMGRQSTPRNPLSHFPTQHKNPRWWCSSSRRDETWKNPHGIVVSFCGQLDSRWREGGVGSGGMFDIDPDHYKSTHQLQPLPKHVHMKSFTSWHLLRSLRSLQDLQRARVDQPCISWAQHCKNEQQTMSGPVDFATGAHRVKNDQVEKCLVAVTDQTDTCLCLRGRQGDPGSTQPTQECTATVCAPQRCATTCVKAMMWWHSSEKNCCEQEEGL